MDIFIGILNFLSVFFLKKCGFFSPVITATASRSCLASLPAGLWGLPAPAAHPGASTGTGGLRASAAEQEWSLCKPSPFRMKHLLCDVPKSDGSGTAVLSSLSSLCSWQAGSPRKWKQGAVSAKGPPGCCTGWVGGEGLFRSGRLLLCTQSLSARSMGGSAHHAASEGAGDDPQLCSWGSWGSPRCTPLRFPVPRGPLLSLQLKPFCPGSYSSGSRCPSPGPRWLPSPPFLFLGQQTPLPARLKQL